MNGHHEHERSSRRPSLCLAFCTLLSVAAASVVLLGIAHWGAGQPRIGSLKSPISLRIMYRCEPAATKGFVVGTADYTFTNDMPFPVAMAFPPICYYTYGSTWQESPFPNPERKLPEFAQKQQVVVLSPRESKTFTSQFGLYHQGERPADLNEAFVFGMPSPAHEHPVVGTIYGAVEFTEAANTK